MSDSLISGILSQTELTATPQGRGKDSPEKIRDAASQFEALLISQVLKTVHEGEGEGWLGTGEDQTSSSAMGLADEYLARAMATRGGLGLAKMISAGLEHRAATAERSGSDQQLQSREPSEPIPDPL